MDELLEKVKLLKENKIEYFKQGDLEIRFAPDAFYSEQTPTSEWESDDDGDDLFMSSGVRPKGVVSDRQERGA